MSTLNKLYVKTELFAPRVDGTDFTTADWAYLGTVDQNIGIANDVLFKSTAVNSGGSFSTKIATAATADYTITFPETVGATGDILTNSGAGVLAWAASGGFDQDLNTTNDVQFNNLILTGDLTVSGTTTLVNTTDLEITDNLVLINSGETGTGVTAGSAGFSVNRGLASNAEFLFIESVDRWTLGYDTGVVIGTDRFYIAEYSDGTQTAGSIPGFDANNRLDVASGLAAAEVTQLQNIDAVTISNAQWAYLGASDQGITSASVVAFAQLTVDQVVINDGSITYSGATGANSIIVPDNLADAWSLTDGVNDYIQVVSTTGSDEVKLLQNTGITGNLTVSGTVAGLTQAELGELANIDTTTISATQWAYLGATDQGLATTDNVQFADLTVTGSLSLSEPIAADVSAVLTADPAPIAASISIFDTSGGAIVPVLPPNAANAGKTYLVHLKVAGNDLTITADGTDTIEGSATFVLDIVGQYTRITSLGDGTWILG